jgi:hypothetical protein
VVESDQDIHVRSFGIVTARDRTKEPHIMRTVAASDFQNLIAPLPQSFPSNRHWHVLNLSYQKIPPGHDPLAIFLASRRHGGSPSSD